MEIQILAEHVYYIVCGTIVGWLLAHLDVYLWTQSQKHRRSTDERDPLI